MNYSAFIVRLFSFHILDNILCFNSEHVIISDIFYLPILLHYYLYLVSSTFTVTSNTVSKLNILLYNIHCSVLHVLWEILWVE